MFKLLTLFCLLFTLPAMAVKPVCDSGLITYKDEWKQCKQDSDCVEAKTVCGFTTTVNTLSLEEAACYFSNISKKAFDCAAMVEPRVRGTKCDSKQNVCIILFDK